MSLLYPRFKLSHFPLMAWMGVQGAVIAGLYGILHDQITYTISPEYFTAFKAEQFRYMDFGWPPRVYVVQIGFMATWWVGFIAGWFLARLTVPHVPREVAMRWCRQAFAVLMAVALMAGIVGTAVGWWEAPRDSKMTSDTDPAGLRAFAESYGVRDIPGFIRVACIHIGSYLGALLGLTGTCLLVRHRVRRFSTAQTASSTAVATSESRTI